MKQTNWIVITGGPCSGKTTIINNLKSKGHFVIPEIARIVIEKELSKGKNIEEVRADEKQLNEKIFKEKLKVERDIPENQLTFLDRGIPDSIAYFRLNKANPSPVIRASKEIRYKKIFALDPLPLQKDQARTESDEEAKLLNEYILKAYSDMGYSVSRVPPVSVEDRLSLILKEIKDI